MKYEPIPEDTEKLVCEIWGCGDVCCCQMVEIFAYLKTQRQHGNNWPSRRKKLWESTWMNESEEIDLVRKETMAACEHYDIVWYDLDSECFWEWEFDEKIVDEKIINKETTDKKTINKET